MTFISKTEGRMPPVEHPLPAPLPPRRESVDHPAHYGGEDNPYEAIKVIEAWELGFCLGNVLKYIARAGKKHPSRLTDLHKARWYLEREIQRIESETNQ